jgi:hypothetical protein
MPHPKILSPEEFASLKEVGRGVMQRIIPDDHRERLITLGYIREVIGSLTVTNIGRMRLALGK